MRWVACLLGVAIIAGACTGSDSESTTTGVADETTSTGPETEPPAVSVNDALGGTQAVQDFAIYLDIWKEAEDGPLSIYPAVVDRAGGTTEPTVNLAGDMVFTPVDALSGHVVDTEGSVVPSLTLDFGLIRPSASSAEQIRRAVLEASEDAGSLGLADLFGRAGPEGGALVVEILSADYEESRTHAGPGDRVALDLTFVEQIFPGDDLGARYMFGQTLPGDPEVEAEMSNVQLFVYRWNRGLIRVLGDGAPRFVVDDDVAAVEGSTLMTREVKEALLFRGTLQGWLAGKLEGERLAAEVREKFENPTFGFVPVDLDGDGIADAGLGPGAEDNSDDEGGAEGSDDEGSAEGSDDEGSAEGSYEIVVVGGGLVELGRFESPDAMISALALNYSLEACVALETFLNEKNASGGLPVAFSDEEGVLPSLESTDPTDPVTGQPDPPPGPVGCVPTPDQQPDPSPTIPKPPLGNVWGDIHIDTIDGNHFSNQAAGEFLLFENDATTVQIRTEPWGESDVVSVATALAFVVGDHKVSVHAGGETRIDGATTQMERGVPMSMDGSELLWWHGGWVVVWPDGTVLRVHEREVALVSSVTPSDGPTTGMLGDNNGDPDNDLFTRDGELLAPDADEDFESFYSTYVDSWRITDEESLFNYDPGENTATFTLEGFPAERVTADDLPDDLFAEALSVCTELGITREGVLENCIIDVAMTDDPMFAYDAYLAQSSIPESADGEAGTEAPPATGDGTSVLAIGDLTIAFGADPPIRDSAGPAPSWTCESADGIYTAISSFWETPSISYQIDLQYIGPDNSRGLDEQFRLIVLRNSEPYAWVQTNAEQFADSVDTVLVQDEVLTASGEMFLNDPPQPGLQPISPLPAGAVLDPFQLQVSCGG